MVIWLYVHTAPRGTTSRHILGSVDDGTSVSRLSRTVGVAELADLPAAHVNKIGHEIDHHALSILVHEAIQGI